MQVISIKKASKVLIKKAPEGAYIVFCQSSPTTCRRIIAASEAFTVPSPE